MKQKTKRDYFFKNLRQKLIASIIFCLAMSFPGAGGLIAAAPDHIVISEIHIDSVVGAGGTEDDWVELYNPTAFDVILDGWSVQKTTGTGGSLARKELTGTIPAGGYFLIVRNDANTSQSLKDAADVLAAGTFSISDDNTVYLVNDNEDITDKNDLNIVDLVGFGDSMIYEGSNTAFTPSESKSISRAADGQDTDNNQADFSLTSSPTPENSGPVVVESKILSFSLENLSPTVVGVINESAKTVSLTVSSDTDITSLTATFTLSGGASASVGGVEQVSAVTANDFTNTVVYTVEASDGATTDYSVTVALEEENGIGGTVLLTIIKNAEPIQNISPTGADIVFQVNSAGSAVVNYGLDNNYGSATPATSVSANADKTITLAGLSCDTVYYYSIYAENTAGDDSDNTSDAVFMTGPCGIVIDSLLMTKMSARANNEYVDGWEWTFNITVWDINETSLKMKFNQWNGAGILDAGNNMQFSVDNGANWLDIAGNDEYSAGGADISGIDNGAGDGRQVEIKVRMKVPVGTLAGDYNSGYGILTE